MQLNDKCMVIPVAGKLVVASYAGQLVIAISSTLPPTTGVIPSCSCTGTGLSTICS